MSKKLYIKVITTAALLSAGALPAHAATTFTDIDGSYAKDAIVKLAESGILNGKGNGKFDPTGTIERQDFAIILAKALGLDVSAPPASATFQDVPAANYAYSAVEAAVKAGLINGYGNGVFGNGNNLSRQDLAVILVRALGVDAAGKAADLKFSDAASISGYAKDAVAVAVELGLISGYPNGTFKPDGSAQRQEVASLTSKFIETLDTLKGEDSSPDTKPSEGDTDASKQPETTPAATGTNSGGGTLIAGRGNSNSSGGGSGSNRPDTTAPTVTVVSASPVKIGQAVAVKSSEAGYVYLVPAANNPLTKVDLDALVSAAAASGAVVSAADGMAEIPTSDLTEGDYKVYAVDSAGNVSAPSGPVSLTAAQELPLEIRLEEGATLYLNSGLLPDQAAVTISSGDTSESAGAEYNKRNIKDLLQVKRGETAGSFKYDPEKGGFNVTDSSTNAVIATVTLSTYSDLVSIIQSSDGIIIIPALEATENTEASLFFNLWENGVLLGSQELRITFDETPPTVTGSTYNEDGTISLTFSEDLSVSPDFGGITLDYSASGDFTDEDTKHLNPFGDYTLTMLSRHEFKIELNPSTAAYLKLQSPGRFRIAAIGGWDFARNPVKLSEPVFIDIPGELF
ncbi:S-layer homology domain-containing protein [Paenibacillus macerans]|uniref:S-layer homology domain-containing protein n=1 Tax=Paenibacillus macerans TaxID=44252 RepID=UPI002040F564|nr:S-layer homology domain-containing protein [Paenibacillus macerans]MCM3703737.1 S-layer homology domain-containing protein [Paenibacillus macerans]